MSGGDEERLLSGLRVRSEGRNLRSRKRSGGERGDGGAPVVEESAWEAEPEPALVRECELVWDGYGEMSGVGEELLRWQ